MRVYFSLFVIGCLLIGCNTGGDAAEVTRLQAAVDSLQAVTQQLQRDLQQAQANTPAASTERTTPLEPVVYFPSGSAWLTDAGKQTIDDLAARIKQEFPNRSIRVEGHADSVPIVGDLKTIYPSNWELSAKRSAAVARYLEETHGITASSLGVAGSAAERPRAANDTPEGRRENRRVQLIVIM